jgi:ParB/RepB/Spo0J family partition protein
LTYLPSTTTPTAGGTTTAPTTSPEQAQHIPLGLLRPRPTNPRKRFTPAKITELAESIKKLCGNFQPILARPNPDYAEGNGQPRYEIVAGERRWRACAEAGMPSVLALVRDISHFDCLEIQLVENIDREDLHPLEEAEGLKALLRDAQGGKDAQGYATADDLAARIGKSRRWVFARLALLNLCESAREAFLADKFSASVAGLIARMPDAGQQADATKRILEGWGGEPYSYRQAAEYLHKEFMLALDKAPFDIAASFQHAGPCGACPKRSGAAPELFDDVKSGDMCQDSACFNAKVDATHQAKLDAARAAGHTVLSGTAARELMPSISTLPQGYHWFDKPCPALTDSKATLRELFGNKSPEVITLDHPGDRIVSLAPDAAVRKLLKAKGLLNAPAAAPAAPASKQKDQQQQEKPAASAQFAGPLSQAVLTAATQSMHRRLLSSLLFNALHSQLQQQNLRCQPQVDAARVRHPRSLALG